MKTLRTPTSNESKSHLAIRAGRRTKIGKGQGHGQSVTQKQLAAYRKALKTTK